MLRGICRMTPSIVTVSPPATATGCAGSPNGRRHRAPADQFPRDAVILTPAYEWFSVDYVAAPWRRVVRRGVKYAYCFVAMQAGKERWR